ncbi:DJ-1/PfpI family protein [Parvibaculum sp.]|uniref:DJ-1/PfpI family protein n=1 Tax=Parvibaculum sp. TaxID=2024848 RepID=UPI0027309065|nr:DJ-1/PfpI family protein [Parvibaculum sp.]MDP1626940.1 DJ-1/PfpI family protein [Parvibaculum sp.]MDP2151664.1 DJ-1/PfpI family protein [Parvibaculum sp.]MDP3328951.1 DJ-1/PfpI family protein [Parvibaculum sp.]
MRRPNIAIPFFFFLLLGVMIVATAADAENPLAAAPIEPKPGHERVVVAVAVLNAGTEVTDFLVPYGILNQAGADVLAVAPTMDPVAFWPSSSARPDADFAGFDAKFPAGADIVIVPAMHDPEDPAMLEWLRAQQAKGALMVSICEGASVMAAAGILDGKRATGHFYEHENRVERYGAVDWQRNRRYVEDEGVISSAGVSASLPISLMLTERIAGPARAKELAAQYGAGDYGPGHDSEAFAIGSSEIATALKNMILGWPRRHYLIEVSEGVDEVNMAFPLDFAARTWRGSSGTIAPKAEIRTRHGLTVIADVTGDAPRGASLVRLPGAESQGEAAVTLADPATLREDFLAFIAGDLGEGTAGFVATQLEYPRN